MTRLIFVAQSYCCTIDIEHYIALFFSCQYFFACIFLKKGGNFGRCASEAGGKMFRFF